MLPYPPLVGHYKKFSIFFAVSTSSTVPLPSHKRSAALLTLLGGNAFAPNAFTPYWHPLFICFHRPPKHSYLCGLVLERKKNRGRQGGGMPVYQKHTHTHIYAYAHTRTYTHTRTQSERIALMSAHACDISIS